MIVPNMTDLEKAYEAFRMTDILCYNMDKCKKEVIEKFKRGTKFPYFQRYVFTDDKRNEWTMLFYILSKAMKKKCNYYTMAYTIYEIPPKRKKNDINAGKGILLFDPYAMKDMINKVPDKRPAIITDIVPHAFNRYTSRYLEPLGQNKMEFRRKVENLLSRWQWFDVLADMYGDKNAEKHSEGNICPYDVIMRGGGMLRGQIVDDILLRFTTYVSEEMMFENQKERQEQIRQEYFSMKREGLIR